MYYSSSYKYSISSVFLGTGYCGARSQGPPGISVDETQLAHGCLLDISQLTPYIQPYKPFLCVHLIHFAKVHANSAV